ncbi:Tetratricopeptide repeat-containing protein [Desulfonatronum zhilinae]|nr:Tetratricopeptide repeat-containing protein [Desulfonatronum zhilinae]
MSAKEKHSRESLPEQEAPEGKGFGDRFEAEIGTQSRAFFDKLVEHWQKLAAAAAVFVVLIAGYAGFNAYQERQLANSEQALSHALLEYHGAERLEALMRLRGEMAEPLLPRHHLEAAKAAQDIGDWATALEYWKLLVDVGPDNWKALARVGRATALLHLGQTGEAVTELTTLRAGASEEFLPLVLLQLAEAAEADGNWELALRTFEELQAREDGQQSDYLAFKASQIRQRMAGESS